MPTASNRLSSSRAKAIAPNFIVNRSAVARLLVFLAVWLTVAVAWGQQITVKPDGGRLLGYAAAASPGKWVVFAAGFLEVKPEVISGGSAIIFQGPAGEYAVVYFGPESAEPVVSKVVLGGGGPVPPPPPPPPPLSAVAKTVQGWATTLVPAAARTKCPAVAASFSTISSRMAAGTLSTPAEILAATRESNVAAVGDQRDAWLPFFEELRKFLNAESEAGKLADVKAHQALWDQIALGLGAVK
jgi:hypothetical protein